MLEINKEVAMEMADTIIRDIKNWFDKNSDNGNAIIGISGGKDSSVVATLCTLALGKDRVIGVLMPNGNQPDIDYAGELVSHLGIKSLRIDIQEAYDNIISQIDFYYSVANQTKINLPARLRMSTLYAVAQSTNGRVMNTCNLSETYVGYETIFGDAAGDYAPLKYVTASEVVAIGKYLGLPERLYNKVPSDGLCGKTDEENLGLKYDDIDAYIKNEQPWEKRTEINEEITNKIKDLHAASEHKRQRLHIPGPLF